MRNVTLKDIAKKLGVSEATVSLALNNKSAVSAGTRDRVLRCAQEMQYKPNTLAKGLATNKTMMIGFICPDYQNPFIGKLLKNADAYCSDLGYSLVMAVSDYKPEREAKILQDFIDRRFDGIIMVPCNVRKNEAAVFRYVLEAKFPIVFCDSYYTGFEDSCVMTDYAAGSYALTKHLLKSGHREIWYMTSHDREVPVSRLRIEGYRKAFQEYGLPCDWKWVKCCERENAEGAYQLTYSLLHDGVKPDAILSINDYMAYGVMTAVKEMGYRIPEDISVAGYDDALNKLLYDSQLTTVKQSADLIARGCVDLLMNKINKESKTDTSSLRNIEADLIIRSSTRNGEEK